MGLQRVVGRGPGGNGCRLINMVLESENKSMECFWKFWEIINRENGCHMVLSENLQYGDIKKGLDVSVINIDDFKDSSLSFSKVIERNDRKNIYINYSDRKSNGAFYIQVNNVVVGYIMTPNEDYDSRGLIFYSCEQNDSLITIFNSMFNKLLKQLYNQRANIYDDGEELSQEDINCMHSSPLYSSLDENKERPRLCIKFNRTYSDNSPNFGLYTLNNNTLSEVKVNNDFKEIETLIDQGTVISSLLLNVRVSIVNESVYLVSRIEELLIDSSLPPVFVPRMDKFSFPKEDHINYSSVKTAENPVEFLPDIKFSYNAENKTVDIQPKRFAVNVDILYPATITEEIKVKSQQMDAVSTDPRNKQRNDGSTVSVKRAPTKRLASSICLYMPATVGVNQTADYSEPDIGGLAKMLAAFSDEFAKSGSFADSFGAIKGDIATSVGEKAKASIDLLMPGAKALAEITHGRVFSNRMEMVFKGVPRRTFSFQFTMMPKSEAEAKSIREICQMFRFYMAPSFEGEVNTSRTFIVPATFDIEYRLIGGGENNFLNKISTSVLTSCDITYGGERTTFFRPTDGGAPPVQTNITLNFKELEIITRERIGAGY